MAFSPAAPPAGATAPPVDAHWFPEVWQLDWPASGLRELDTHLNRSQDSPRRGRGEDLARLDLRGMDLENQELADADLRGADLRRARLWGASLRRAWLQGADLRDCDLTLAVLKGALYDDTTRWPHGFDPELRGLERAS